MLLALALFLVSVWAAVMLAMMVVVLFPFSTFPVTVTVVISIALPPFLNNDRCSDDDWDGGWRADINAYVDCICRAGHANSKARNERCQKRVFHAVFRNWIRYAHAA